MTVRSASAEWNGTLKQGSGRMKLGSGGFDGAFSFDTRFGQEPGTNPEELIGGALAGCFSMFLAALLEKAKAPPVSIRTSAKVHLSEAPAITLIELTSEIDAPGIEDAAFQSLVATAKQDCPVSKALTGTQVSVTARLAR